MSLSDCFCFCYTFSFFRPRVLPKHPKNSFVQCFLNHWGPSRSCAVLSIIAGRPPNDPWVGALAEDHLPTAAVGPLIKEIIVDQFTRLLNCDRFWWTNDPGLSSSDKNIIKNTSLSLVIKNNINSALRGNIPRDVFHSLVV